MSQRDHLVSVLICPSPLHLQYVADALSDGGWTEVAGIHTPIRLATWVELIVISWLVPNVSFLGHLCGKNKILCFLSHRSEGGY